MKLSEAAGAEWLDEQVKSALAEDLGNRGDITCQATVQEALHGRAELVAKQRGVVAGTEWARRCGELSEPQAQWSFHVEDGQRVQPGMVLAEVTGPLWGILISERTALNGFGHLSGIATAAAKASELVQGTNARVIDTRKTTPGWRRAEKYAVRVGGCDNHRLGLYDEFLIKENHIRAAGGVRNAIEKALHFRDQHADLAGSPIEVEVTSLEELDEALKCGPDRVLLDNFAHDELREAVRRAGDGVTLEASGGVTLGNLRQVAMTGVHRISMGMLTHSVTPLDVSLLLRETF